ncbi:hypothetical protein F6I28_08270 [Streptococcus anginosus]|nr:hypothetical protein SAG0087_01600 [Streptococcus agalactiae LMG 15091]EPW14080.1 hypothetical protein SAG0049_10305 [Streptococcus agalactiae CCUG 91]EPW29099.1 hypothetical protein SAG0069_00520 [Streptococcus agalactiae CCUG 44074]KAA9253546.1 hypothetical protein F6I28_08270 [Streptococcus anginosus]KLJ40073.1 hypothetical protein WA51_07185 [Streptococcus agalactiae]
MHKYPKCHIEKMKGRRSYKMQKCTKCPKGDWGFPQIVKRLKFICGDFTNKLSDLFIFACVRTHANLAREQVYSL